MIHHPLLTIIAALDDDDETDSDHDHHNDSLQNQKPHGDDSGAEDDDSYIERDDVSKLKESLPDEISVQLADMRCDNFDLEQLRRTVFTARHVQKTSRKVLHSTVTESILQDMYLFDSSEQHQQQAQHQHQHANMMPGTSSNNDIAIDDSFRQKGSNSFLMSGRASSSHNLLQRRGTLNPSNLSGVGQISGLMGRSFSNNTSDANVFHHAGDDDSSSMATSHNPGSGSGIPGNLLMHYNDQVDETFEDKVKAAFAQRTKHQQHRHRRPGAKEAAAVRGDQDDDDCEMEPCAELGSFSGHIQLFLRITTHSGYHATTRVVDLNLTDQTIQTMCAAGLQMAQHPNIIYPGRLPGVVTLCFFQVPRQKTSPTTRRLRNRVKGGRKHHHHHNERSEEDHDSSQPDDDNDDGANSNAESGLFHHHRGEHDDGREDDGDDNDNSSNNGVNFIAFQEESDVGGFDSQSVRSETSEAAYRRRKRNNERRTREQHRLQLFRSLVADDDEHMDESPAAREKKEAKVVFSTGSDNKILRYDRAVVRSRIMEKLQEARKHAHDGEGENDNNGDDDHDHDDQQRHDESNSRDATPRGEGGCGGLTSSTPQPRRSLSSSTASTRYFTPNASGLLLSRRSSLQNRTLSASSFFLTRHKTLHEMGQVPMELREPLKKGGEMIELDGFGTGMMKKRPVILSQPASAVSKLVANEHHGQDDDNSKTQPQLHQQQQTQHQQQVSNVGFLRANTQNQQHQQFGSTLTASAASLNNTAFRSALSATAGSTTLLRGKSGSKNANKNASAGNTVADLDNFGLLSRSSLRHYHRSKSSLLSSSRGRSRNKIGNNDDDDGDGGVENDDDNEDTNKHNNTNKKRTINGFSADSSSFGEAKQLAPSDTDSDEELAAAARGDVTTFSIDIRKRVSDALIEEKKSEFMAAALAVEHSANCDGTTSIVSTNLQAGGYAGTATTTASHNNNNNNPPGTGTARGSSLPPLNHLDSFQTGQGSSSNEKNNNKTSSGSGGEGTGNNPLLTIIGHSNNSKQPTPGGSGMSLGTPPLSPRHEATLPAPPSFIVAPSDTSPLFTPASRGGFGFVQPQQQSQQHHHHQNQFHSQNPNNNSFFNASFANDSFASMSSPGMHLLPPALLQSPIDGTHNMPAQRRSTLAGPSSSMSMSMSTTPNWKARAMLKSPTKSTFEAPQFLLEHQQQQAAKERPRFNKATAKRIRRLVNRLMRLKIELWCGSSLQDPDALKLGETQIGLTSLLKKVNEDVMNGQHQKQQLDLSELTLSAPCSASLGVGAGCGEDSVFVCTVTITGTKKKATTATGDGAASSSHHHHQQQQQQRKASTMSGDSGSGSSQQLHHRHHHSAVLAEQRRQQTNLWVPPKKIIVADPKTVDAQRRVAEEMIIDFVVSKTEQKLAEAFAPIFSKLEYVEKRIMQMEATLDQMQLLERQRAASAHMQSIINLAKGSGDGWR